MVRKHNYARQADRAWARLTAAAPPDSIPEGGTDAGSDQAMDGPDHPPHFGTHSHLHFAYGHHTGDSGGLHTHSHHHGFTGDNGAEWDNDHDHDHSESDFGVHGQPDANPYVPQSRYSKHIRFERGGVTVLNMIERDRHGRHAHGGTAAAAADPREALAQVRPGSAYAALWRADAPGAPLNGKVGSIGELAAGLYRPAERARMIRRLSAGLTTRIPAEGGFLVGEELRSELMLSAIELGIIRKRALVIPDGGEFRVNVPVLEENTEASTVMGGLQLSWTPEGVALTSTSPSFGRVTLQAKKLAGELVTPNELYQDADQLDTFLRQSIPQAIAFYEDQAFIAGGGTTSAAGSQPLGILNASCALLVTRQTSSSVTIVDVYSMVKRMLPRSLNSFIWLASPDTFSQLMDLYINFGSATSGISPPPDWLRYDSAEGCWTLLGRPFYSTGHVSALGTQGDLVAVDPSFVVIADRMELAIDVADQGVGFGNDESYVRIRERVDSRVWLAQAITPANSSEQVSPVVILK